MGRPMGMNLIKAGYPLTVWNRTPSRADELVAAGAKLAKSPGEVAAAADFLLTIVSDPPALEEVLWGNCGAMRSEEHTSELQSRLHLVCRLLLEKKKKISACHDTLS